MPKNNLANKLSNSEEGIVAGSEEIRNYFHITFGFLTRVLGVFFLSGMHLFLHQNKF